MRRWIIFLFIWLIASSAFAEEMLKVTIPPFKVYAQKVIKGLGEEIQQKLITNLPPDKVQVVSWKGPIPKDKEAARKKADALGADYIIIGTLTQFGEKWSLDAMVIETGGIRPSFSVYAEIPSLDKLDQSVKKLSEEILLKLFKKEKVAKVEIVGNKGIDADAILAVIKTRKGELFNPKIIRQDIKAIFKMGYFRDIKVEVEDSPQGKLVRFVVTEKPLVKQIIIKGNKHISDEKIKEAIALKVNSIFKQDLLTKSIKQIKTLYEKEGYFDAEVNYEVVPIDKQAIKVVFHIKEGEKAYLKKVIFEGNKAFSDETLKKLLKNKEHWFLSFLTGSGKLKRDELENDVNRIANFYYNHGYINAKVGEPRIERKGREIYIIFPIEEGVQYHVGKVEVKGDLIKPASELKKKLSLKPGDVYSREKLQKDIFALSDIYANKGFAYVEVNPQITPHPDKRLMDITYQIKKGPKVYIDRIEIVGNTKTRDKVIRRELWIKEGEVFSKKKLEESINALRRLGYFEDVQVETEKGKELNEVNIKIKVKEQPTGSLSLGAGYSSVEKFLVMADITQRNFLGKGQKVTLRAYLGSVTKRYDFDFTEPYFRDTKLSTGLSVFKWDTEYIDYTKQSSGGEIRLSYPLGHFSRIYGAYRYENAKTADFDPDNASTYITELAQGITTSSIRLTWKRDTRNRFFNPNKGTVVSTTVEFAGFGGDSKFVRYEGSSSIFIPLFWDTVGFVRVKAGYIDKLPGGILPLFEKYYLGGPYTIRGYDFATISPRYCYSTEDGERCERIGGNKMVLCNLEYRFPLVKKVRLVGVVFFDMGNVYDTGQALDFSHLKKSVGIGIRWFSPMGPIRLEWARALDAEAGESTSNWEFAMGTFF
jgi:outer membrane protein insertion porin family